MNFVHEARCRMGNGASCEALWAKENHRPVARELTTMGKDYPQTYKVNNAIFAPTGNARLTGPVDAASVSLYGIWKQKK
ncbi:hypothetical protein NK639_09600 [Pseudomonas sp. ZM24]|nr:hypothetical protein [Pseudomonas triclosanedens]MCP8475799.1 hypothetical protein [Pseudomonas triclosanedens]